MGTNYATKAALLAGLSAAFAPTPADPLPPEFAVIAAAVAALPEAAYNYYDVEQDGVPGWCYALHHTRVAEGDGSAAGSFGYGDLQWLLTGQGPGVACNVGGSSFQSATGFYVVPAELAAVVAE